MFQCHIILCDFCNKSIYSTDYIHNTAKMEIYAVFILIRCNLCISNITVRNYIPDEDYILNICNWLSLIFQSTLTPVFLVDKETVEGNTQPGYAFLSLESFYRGNTVNKDTGMPLFSISFIRYIYDIEKFMPILNTDNKEICQNFF